MKKQPKLLLASLFIVMTNGAFSFASTPHTGSGSVGTIDSLSDKSHTLATLRVDGSRERDRLSGSTAGRRLGAEQMKLSGVADISDAMRRIPGVNLRDYGGAGGMKTVSLRGLGAQHTGVVYDGVALSDIRTGESDLSRYNLNDISSVTLNAGESDRIFLPARSSATASTLIISTFSESDVENPAWQLTARLKVGGYGLYNPFVSVSKAVAGKAVISASGDFITAKNNYCYTVKNGSDTRTYRRKNSNMLAGRGELSCFIRPSVGTSVTLKGYYYGSDRHLPGPALYYDPANHERLFDRNAFGQATVKSRLSSLFSLQATAKFNWADSHYEDIDEKYTGGRLDRYYWQREYYLSAALLCTPIENLSIDYSADWFLNNFNSNAADDKRPYRNSILQVLAAKYRFFRFSVTAKALYVPNSNGVNYQTEGYGTTASVVNLKNFTVTKTITTPLNPTEFYAMGGNLYLLSKGNYADVPAILSKMEEGKDGKTDFAKICDATLVAPGKDCIYIINQPFTMGEPIVEYKVYKNGNLSDLQVARPDYASGMAYNEASDCLLISSYNMNGLYPSYTTPGYINVYGASDLQLKSKFNVGVGPTCIFFPQK